MHERFRGVIKVWNDEKGFGFITATNGDPDIFFHITSVSNSRRRDLVGQRVTYELQVGREGKLSASNIRLAVVADDLVLKHSRLRGGTMFAWAFSVLYIGVVTFMLRNHTLYIPIAYIVLSVFTYATYSHDKQCALDGNWRTPELILHMMEILGGWPGALVAQWSLYHKNRKASYQVVFWFIVVVHVTTVAFFIKLR